mgnify:CR=1 FL=1
MTFVQKINNKFNKENLENHIILLLAEDSVLGGAMNKSDLIEALSTKLNLTEKKAIDVVNLIFKGFTDELKKNGRIEIRGFGSFVVKKYGSYTGRNPKTGTKIEVEPKKLPFFKVGKELKVRVDKKK